MKSDGYPLSEELKMSFSAFDIGNISVWMMQVGKNIAYLVGNYFIYYNYVTHKHCFGASPDISR